MRFADVAATSADVAGTRSRKAKTAAIARLLRVASADELPVIVTWLAGDLRQGRIGVGWATVFGTLADRAGSGEPPLEVADVDAAFTTLAATAGEGSQATRRAVLDALFDRTTEPEARLLRSMLTGELRHGALGGVVLDAIAEAFAVPAAAVRRAHLLSGDLGDAATAAAAGEEALAEVHLRVGRALQPMLASTAPSVEAAMEGLGTVSVEWKLDGARVQVHRVGDDVRVFTRNLNDVTHRLPEVVSCVRAFDVHTVVLDGEVLGLDADERPRAFQQTMSRFGTDDGITRDPDDGSSTHEDTELAAEIRRTGRLAPFFFDCLHVDGRDLLDEPLHVRAAELDRFAGPHRVPGVLTSSLEDALAVQTEALGRGHEGVMVKAAASTYDAGRRGAAWRKVKPVRTFDLVVLACEWGSGRRRGWLSNLHLGARDPRTGSFVMVGKTFKGLTDALLTWQTAALLEREVRRTEHVVWVRPELVVEIALDGVQHSSRYPGGVAMRFARVKGYRPDKVPGDADTIDDLRALLPPLG